MWKSSLLWAVVAMMLVIFGIVRDQSEMMTPFIILAVAASTFLLGADRIAKAIENK